MEDEILLSEFDVPKGTPISTISGVGSNIKAYINYRVVEKNKKDIVLEITNIYFIKGKRKL